MFDANVVGKKIKDARIRKNMTQSTLADEMCVSYQAVSNWERGNAMPDIGKLGDLCRILDLDLYELLGEAEDVRLAEKVICDSQISHEAEGLLHTETDDKQTSESGEKKESFSVESIIRFAPYLTPEELMDLLTGSDVKITKMSDLIQLAPFVDGDVLEIIGEETVPKDIGEVVALSPFVSDETIAHFIEKLSNLKEFSLDTGLLRALGPFLSEKKLDELAEKVTPGSYEEICSAAPFLSEKAIAGLIGRVPSGDINDVLKGLKFLMPFISSETLKLLLLKYTDTK